MTRTEQIRTQLEQGHPGGPGKIAVCEEGLEVRVALADWDRLGCLLERLEMRQVRGLSLPITPAALEKTVTYLGESLRTIEAEEARGRALLRSAPPCLHGGKIAFFEMTLDRAEGLSLARYAYDREREAREVIAAPLTRHALERLVDDLLTLGTGA